METWVLLITITLILAQSAVVTIVFIFLKELRDLTEDTKQIVGQGVKVDPQFSMFVDLATDIWRLSKISEALSGKLEEKEIRRIRNCIGRMNRFLEKNDIEYGDYTGRKANGVNVDTIAMEQDKMIKSAIIFETYTPEIKHKGVIRKKSQVVIHIPEEIEPTPVESERIDDIETKSATRTDPLDIAKSDPNADDSTELPTYDYFDIIKGNKEQRGGENGKQSG